LIDDSEADAELVLAELCNGGYETAWERVETAAALMAALARQPWDVILCDYVMPQFSAPAALQLIREHGIDIPVIIVSGQVGEEVAVTAMKGGAYDYVSKHKLTRLCPAVERELREAEGQRARKYAEEALRASEQKYRNLVETVHDVIWSIDVAGRCTFINRAVKRLLGYEPEEIVGRPFGDFMRVCYREQVFDHISRMKDGKPRLGYEVELLRKDGAPVVVSANAVVSCDERGNVVGASGTLLEITQSKRG
jgi:sigma-B regulation protein RsbU (phosphoserine phosphatase)